VYFLCALEVAPARGQGNGGLVVAVVAAAGAGGEDGLGGKGLTALMLCQASTRPMIAKKM
jgi:hypothetical protein